MPDESPSLIVERHGAVAHLTLNRPTVLNALDRGLADRLHGAALAVSADPAVRAVVLKGAGRAFMAGGDIAAFHAMGHDAPRAVAPLIARFHEVLRVLAEMPKPLIAAVHGAVAGAGVSLLLAADLAVAADDTQISLAYTRLGTSADGGATWALPRVVGLRKAMEIALLNQPIGAAEALRLSLVNKVVAAGDFEAETRAFAARLAEGPAFAVAAMKRLLRTSFERDFAGQLAAEAESFAACAGTDDFREGVEAFLSKRPPRFGGT